MNTVDHFSAVAAVIPKALLRHSGKAFYSGRNAFVANPALFILGGNPGGSPDSNASETIESHTRWVADKAPSNWSAYRDESWKGKPPGQQGMQPRILHALRTVGLDPGLVPASNVVFVRSARHVELEGDFETLAEQCWPFHEYVLHVMQPRVVLCLGSVAGDFICRKIGAHQRIGTFIEQNKRNWQSHSYVGVNTPTVVVATHPSIADWKAPQTDPTALLKAALYDV